MAAYKLMNDPNMVQRLADGACIPFAAGNRDFRIYQEWLGAGNTPDPADAPPAPDTRRQDVMEALQEIIDDILQPPRLRKLALMLKRTL